MPLMFLVIVNLLPLLGVTYWGWDLGALLYLYWLESLVVGIFNIAKILNAGPGTENRYGVSLFFVIHYGLFWVVHGVFLISALLPRFAEYSSSETGFEGLAAINLKWVLLSMIAAHAMSYVIDFLRTPQTERRSPIFQMFIPYGRVMVMHVVILLGAFYLASQSQDWGVLLLFTVLKILMDLFTYRLFDVQKSQT